MEYIILLSFFGAGLIIGISFTWIIFKIKSKQIYNEAKNVVETQLAIMNERLQGKDAELQEVRYNLKEKDAQVIGLQEFNLNLRSKQAELETRLQDTQQMAGEKLTLLDNAQQRLSDVFKALSAEALNSNNRAFLDLAQSTLSRFSEGAKSDLEMRHQAIATLVAPITDTLVQFDTKIQEIEKARVGAYSSITEQLQLVSTTQDKLRIETANLVSALRKPMVRGRWGEIQLKRVVEMAGMLEHCDFSEQESIDSEDGRLRPDVIVHLPGNKTVIVDAKAPLDAYLDALQVQDEDKRVMKLKEHARHIRNHISSLAKKSYWKQFPTSPEFVVLFLPGEVFFSAALENDPSLIEAGIDERVILATPTTLIALLRAVAYGWNQESITKYAQEVAALGKELYKRIFNISEDWRKVGKSLGNAVEAYNKATGSLESRVLVSARKLKDMEITFAAEVIEEIPQVDRATRELPIPEVSEALLS